MLTFFPIVVACIIIHEMNVLLMIYEMNYGTCSWYDYITLCFLFCYSFENFRYVIRLSHLLKLNGLPSPLCCGIYRVWATESSNMASHISIRRTQIVAWRWRGLVFSESIRRWYRCTKTTLRTWLSHGRWVHTWHSVLSAMPLMIWID